MSTSEKAKVCAKCGAKFGLFRWRHTCEKCGDTFCSSCVTFFDTYDMYLLEKPMLKYDHDFLCKGCWGEDVALFDAKYKLALKEAGAMESYPATYRGKIPLDNSRLPLAIKSGYYLNKQDALLALKITAYVRGYDVIYGYTYTDTTKSKTSDGGKGLYFYSVWAVQGHVGILRQ